ncbi:hypothetical protein CCR75_006529 [Bremia lactucae]|uniref:Uncharacterized protein n=1 Tax=Bremia lactucae TaxID=4779 RepID=A0A976FPX9_BRELC|nr:hypothetical protein CCR75_006529 [Bremia lactucae]
MDEAVVNPVATRLAGSVANPAVLSFLLWDRLKTLAPQPARDLARLLSTVLSDALSVFGADRGMQLRSNAKQLQVDFFRAASSRSGREVALNSVATAAKMAQALNTPETKATTQQLFMTLQSVVDFFAIDDGRRIISSLGDCFSSACEMAASPEASIFMAELATNLLHTLESEERRHHYTPQGRKDVKMSKDGNARVSQHEFKASQETETERLDSPSSSMGWSFDTESELSSAPATPIKRVSMNSLSKNDNLPSLSPSRSETRARQVSISSPAERNSGYRSARIEKEVLLKMGVDPSMLSEIQHVLDVLAADEMEKLRVETLRRREEAACAASLVVPEPANEAEQNSLTSIGCAFGNDEKEEKRDAVSNGSDEISSSSPIDHPVWHENQLREALRRRHGHAEAVAGQREMDEHRIREMAAILAQRHIEHGELQPADIIACRIIAKMFVYGVAVLFILISCMLIRMQFT